jgi:hypothetical protein
MREGSIQVSTFYLDAKLKKTMLELNKYEEKLMQLEMVDDVANGMMLQLG